jgi:polysaccharide deacetylase 2 family uncharacterized protein YibQ
LNLSPRATSAVFVLAAVAIAGILLVKFLESPRGSVFLLDLGFTGRYEAVQSALGGELRRAVGKLGLREVSEERAVPVAVGARQAARREWALGAADNQSLVRINLALTEAVHRAGGVVRSSKEAPDGSGLTLEMGSRRHTTHRIVVGRGLGPAVAARDGEPRGRPDSRADEGDRGERARPVEPPRRIALVIDDFGYSRGKVVEDFLEIDIPLTVSVIPTLAYSRYVLERASQAGKHAILHLPMEAEAYASDVPPVETSMSREEIDSLVEKYLDETPGAVGVNNHLGSLATRDARVMEAVITVIARHHLFFFDSLTSSKSIAYNTALRLGVPSVRNDLFIDADTEDRRVVAERLARLIDIAKTRGSAVGIGHPRPWTLDAIRECRGIARDAGVEFVFLSSVVGGKEMRQWSD